ncbi:MAG TPA: GDSL-type esterase/lipase family protein [bacterium]|nr:GDSL-type esterase/lipase family protein [bacterium]HQI49718.1 GDSL-type esterase/lipase family protein [bacterium]HQJ65852.1 GDSL-type esterase/lipase family protein [bacterium]
MHFCKRIIATLLLGATLLFGQDLLLQDQEVVVTLGNSITELGENPAGYVNLMRKSLAVLYPERRIYLVNAGISGHKSTDMAERFQRDVLDFKPAWVTISVGVNDVWHGFLARERGWTQLSAVPLAVYKEKVVEMVRRAQAQNIKVALFTTTVIKENLDSPENRALVPYNQALREIAKKEKCLLVDQDAAFRRVLQPLQKPGMSDRGILTYDGVHMLPAGDGLMARTALLAFGVSAIRLDQGKGLIEPAVRSEQEALKQSLARYAETNAEAGLPRPAEKRVVFYGSSSVDNWNLAQDFPGVPILNRGIGGESTHQFWLRYRQDVAQLKPAAMILFCGSLNDLWPDKRMNLDESRANIARLCRMAASQNIQVAVGAIMPVNDYLSGKEAALATHPIGQIQALNRWIQMLCEREGYQYLDFYTTVADSTGKLRRELSDDGMHCNAAGYTLWKPLVATTLKSWQITPKPGEL